DLGGPQIGINGDSWTPETAHQPDLNYLPYLTSGSHYQLELLQAQADFSTYSVWGYGVAFDSTGTVPTGFASFFNNANFGSNGNQVRAVAWSLREVAEAAYLTPDGDPMKAYFTNELNIALNGLVQQYIVDNQNGRYGQLNGFVNPPAKTGVDYTEDYVAMSLGLIAGMNIPQASS